MFLLNTSPCYALFRYGSLFWPLTSRPTNRRVAVCSAMFWWCGEATAEAIVDIRILWQLLSFSSPRPSFLPASSHALPNLPTCPTRFLLPPIPPPPSRRSRRPVKPAQCLANAYHERAAICQVEKSVITASFLLHFALYPCIKWRDGQCLGGGGEEGKGRCHVRPEWGGGEVSCTISPD